MFLYKCIVGVLSVCCCDLGGGREKGSEREGGATYEKEERGGVGKVSKGR